MTPGSAVSGAAGAALPVGHLGVPLDWDKDGNRAPVPGDHQVPAVVLDLGDVLRQARLQVARAHGVTQRFGHELSVQPGSHYDHIL